MNKAFAKVGVVGMVVLGITECHMITAPAVYASNEVAQVQTLETGRIRNIVGTEDSSHGWIDLNPTSFVRGTDYKIITIAPWEKPEVAQKQMSTEHLIRILKRAGFEGRSLKMAQAIVFLESNRRMYAHNTNASTGDNSYGLFQINMFKGLEASRLEKFDLSKNEDLFNPLKNAEIAYQISDGGSDWSAWTTYKEAKKIVNQFSY